MKKNINLIPTIFFFLLISSCQQTPQPTVKKVIQQIEKPTQPPTEKKTKKKKITFTPIKRKPKKKVTPTRKKLQLPEEEKSEESKIEEDKSKIEGTYFAIIPTSKKASMTYTIELKPNKSARLLIFKSKKNTPKIFHGKWLNTKDNIIIMYFENHIPASEFFKKRTDGNLTILQRNKQPYTGKLYDYMVLKKIPKSELK